uniref:Uncharacterized protein n=1 Tax=Chrysotila carterae TaxID=13221 RepID=A0A7S4B212_CHRCT
MHMQPLSQQPLARAVETIITEHETQVSSVWQRCALDESDLQNRNWRRASKRLASTLLSRLSILPARHPRMRRRFRRSEAQCFHSQSFLSLVATSALPTAAACQAGKLPTVAAAASRFNPKPFDLRFAP